MKHKFFIQGDQERFLFVVENTEGVKVKPDMIIKHEGTKYNVKEVVYDLEAGEVEVVLMKKRLKENRYA